MAKDRLEPCVYYIYAGECEKGREADHRRYCQKCGKYVPKVKVKHPNQKKQKLDKIREKERAEYYE